MRSPILRDALCCRIILYFGIGVNFTLGTCQLRTVLSNLPRYGVKLLNLQDMKGYSCCKVFLLLALIVLFVNSVVVGCWMWERGMLLFGIGYFLPIILAAAFVYCNYKNSNKGKND